MVASSRSVPTSDRAGRPRARVLATRLRPLVALALAAACTGSPAGSTGVASLEGHVAGSGHGAGPSPAGPGDPYRQELAYSQCMRAHGLADFPDPQVQADGTVARRIEVQQGSDLDPNTPGFQAAARACQSLAAPPPQGQRTQQQARQQAQALEYASCMRAHGVPTFPDPVFSNGISFGDNGTYDPNSASFQAADHACGSLLSGGNGAGAPGDAQNGGNGPAPSGSAPAP